MENFILTSNCDGLELSGLSAGPDSGKCNGIVQIVHGMCEHKERYIPFMEFLSSEGYSSVIIDHRGHGASVRCPEDLGYLYDDGWNSLIEDQKTLRDFIRTKYPDEEYCMLGHSMGALVARAYAKRYDDTLDLLILSGSPSDNPAKGIGKWVAGLIGSTRGWHFRPAIMQKMSFGAYNKPFKSEGYHSAWVCSDREVLRTYHNDPLCQFVFTANGFYNLLRLMEDVYSTKGWVVSNPSLPVHFLSGGDDSCRISDKALADAVNLMRSIGYKKTDLKIYPHMRHEILNETGKQQVWTEVLQLLQTTADI